MLTIGCNRSPTSGIANSDPISNAVSLVPAGTSGADANTTAAKGDNAAEGNQTAGGPPY